MWEIDGQFMVKRQLMLRICLTISCRFFPVSSNMTYLKYSRDLQGFIVLNTEISRPPYSYLDLEAYLSLGVENRPFFFSRRIMQNLMSLIFCGVLEALSC